MWVSIWRYPARYKQWLIILVRLIFYKWIHNDFLMEWCMILPIRLSQDWLAEPFKRIKIA